MEEIIQTLNEILNRLSSLEDKVSRLNSRTLPLVTLGPNPHHSDGNLEKNITEVTQALLNLGNSI